MNCPFCGQTVEVTWSRSFPDSFTLAGCEHLNDGGGSDCDPEEVLQQKRAWNAPEGVAWPFRDGWPTTAAYDVHERIAVTR
jgi:hypothetical protein